jgi:hypothetical protein
VTKAHDSPDVSWRVLNKACKGIDGQAALVDMASAVSAIAQNRRTYPIRVPRWRTGVKIAAKDWIDRRGGRLSWT